MVVPFFDEIRRETWVSRLPGSVATGIELKGRVGVNRFRRNPTEKSISIQVGILALSFPYG